jgi:adenylate cyclase
MNTQPNLPYEYQVGGALEVDAPSYVVRQADDDLYNALKAGKFCYVLNSRQMGKSSLRVRTRRRLENENVACASIDLTGIGSEDATSDKWYTGIIYELKSNFSLEIDLKTWLREHKELNPVHRLREFIEQVLLGSVRQSIVIFVDEIDSVLALNFGIDDFFAFIRFCYNQRAEQPEYNRLTFALLGVATPPDLIRDKNRTPFNIGHAIELNGFQFQEAKLLAQGLASKTSNPQTVLREVLAWTGGQPFLTQKLCQLVLDAESVIASGEEELWIENLVRSRIIENWESQDEPEHLRTIRDRILRNEQRASRRLGLYQQILLQGGVEAENTYDHMELRLSGLVVERQGKLRVYNRIYEAVFNQSWVDKAIADLRPYAELITAWLASNCKDELRLLRGQALRDAQVWAEGRSLSDRDYQFLAASQELAQREIQIALEAEQKARTEVLQVLKQVTEDSAFFAPMPPNPVGKTSLSKFFKPFSGAGPRVAALITLVVTGLLLGLRQVGGFQPLELAAFDRMMQLRPALPPDPRLLLVEVTQADIQSYGFPLKDATIAQLLSKLEQYQPAVIGLDIYRDIPHPPGNAELSNLLQKSDRIVSICKLSDAANSGTPPPPKVPLPPPKVPIESVGFSDVAVDPQGVVRRALLFGDPPSKSSCTSTLSFSLQLAQRYLAQKEIQPELTPQQYLKFGKVVFKRLKVNDGGYQQADIGGYQILLNYRSGGELADSVTLSDVLNNRVDPHWIKDRVVLIGTTAPSRNDLLYTPYSTGQIKLERTPGVVIHGQITSQLLSTVLDGRPPFWFWSEWVEVLWIVGWAVVGGSLAWYIRHPLLLGLSSIGTSLILLGTCFGIFLLQGWVPVMTPAIAFVINGGAVAAYRIIRQRQINQLVKWIDEKNYATGVALNFSDKSLMTTNLIFQLPDSHESGWLGVKELLTQLQTAIESESNLTPEDKANALEQVATLAVGVQNPTDKEMQKLAKTAIRMLRGMMVELPNATQFVEAGSTLLPEISRLLGLG